MGVPQILLYLMIAIYFASLSKIFVKAGRENKWEGFIPGYNIWVWLKVIKKPWWWIFFFIIPFVNFIVTIACNVETARLFGKYSTKDTLLTILVPWYMIPHLAYADENVLVEETDWAKQSDRDERKNHDMLTLFFIAPFVGHALYFVFRLVGSKDKPKKKTMAKEWTDALGFAIVAATIIRVFFFEAFTIPTGSMEKTMRVGDYLFVNKVKYGAKMPETPLSVPFIHNRIPGTHIPSFVEWFKIDYMRLPGYSDVERGDIVVFNWPVGDTVILHDDVIAHDYYQIVRNHAWMSFQRASGIAYTNGGFEDQKANYLLSEKNRIVDGGGLLYNPSVQNKPIEKTGGITTLPVDKKENYIKRCVAIAGDSLQIVNGQIRINGDAGAMPLPEEALFTHRFYLNSFDPQFGGYPLDSAYLVDEFEVYPSDLPRVDFNYQNPLYSMGYEPVEGDTTGKTRLFAYFNVSPANAKKIGALPQVDEVKIVWEEESAENPYTDGYCSVFPNDPSFHWSKDNFGPVYIPKAGDKIEMNEANFIIYKRSIAVYEKNEDVYWKDGAAYINGKVAKSYTFKQNYYWMMGDNRHGSVDSRFWGFVPEDHVVGTASFVWFSKHPETGIRWSRIFSFVD